MIRITRLARLGLTAGTAAVLAIGLTANAEAATGNIRYFSASGQEFRIDNPPDNICINLQVRAQLLANNTNRTVSYFSNVNCADFTGNLAPGQAVTYQAPCRCASSAELGAGRGGAVALAPGHPQRPVTAPPVKAPHGETKLQGPARRVTPREASALEVTVRYRRELRAGDQVEVTCAFLWGEGKTLGIEQTIRTANGAVAAEITEVGGLMDLKRRRLVDDPRAVFRTLAADPELFGL